MDEMPKNKKLKLLVVFNSLTGVVGGASRHIIEVANYWSESCEVDFLISKSGYIAMNKYFQKNPGKIILYSTPFDNSRNRFLVYASRIITNILMVPKLKRNYDIIIAPNYLPQNMIPAIFLKGKKSKLVVYFHTVQPALRASYLKGMNFLQRSISILNWTLCVFLARSFDLIFVVNNVTKNYFVKKGFDQSRVIEIDNAIPYKKILNIKQGDKEYDAVFLSRLNKRKGIYDLIKVWRLIIEKHPAAKLCIIGDGDEREALINKIKAYNLEKNIVLTGGVSDDDKFSLMKKSKIFLFPSYYEAKPIVVIEAFACELPVIAYDLPVYKENYNGYVFTVEIEDVRIMAEKTIDVLEHIQEYEPLIQESKKFASKFDWGVVAKHELVHFQNIL